jgi:hypothetical protein
MTLGAASDNQSLAAVFVVEREYVRDVDILNIAESPVCAVLVSNVLS